MTNAGSASGVPRGVFHTTRWSVVLSAGRGDSSRARDALETLARSYWYPLYAYLRRWGCDADEAEDLTQGFFALLLERRDLAAVGPEKGRFRSFLLTALRHFLLNERERARARKRGGDRVVLSLDGRLADERWLGEPSHEETPERVFERLWARSVLERSLTQLEEDYRERGRSLLFDALRPHLTGEDEAPAHAELAAHLEMTEGAVKVALHRLRKHYGARLRNEVAETVADPDQVEEELRRLLEVLAP